MFIEFSLRVMLIVFDSFRVATEERAIAQAVSSLSLLANKNLVRTVLGRFCFLSQLKSGVSWAREIPLGF